MSSNVQLTSNRSSLGSILFNTSKFSLIDEENELERIEVKVRCPVDSKLGIRVASVPVGVVLVKSVASDSSCIGVFQSGDYIVCINGQRVRNVQNLYQQVNESKTKEFTFVVVRAKQLSSMTSSRPSTVTSRKNEEQLARQAAENFGFKLKDNKVYRIVKLTKIAKKPLGLGLTNNGKKVKITRVESNSYAVDTLKVNDNLLAVNDEKVTDKRQCIKLFEDKDEFEVLVESRKKKSKDSSKKKAKQMEKKGTVVKSIAESTYTKFDCNNVTHKLGNPLSEYRPAPQDVQKIINERLQSIVSAFRCNENVGKTVDGTADKLISKNESDSQSATPSKQVAIHLEVNQVKIPSDVHPDYNLKKPSR